MAGGDRCFETREAAEAGTAGVNESSGDLADMAFVPELLVVPHTLDNAHPFREEWEGPCPSRRVPSSVQYHNNLIELEQRDDVSRSEFLDGIGQKAWDRRYH